MRYHCAGAFGFQNRTRTFCVHVSLEDMGRETYCTLSLGIIIVRTVLGPFSISTYDPPKERIDVCRARMQELEEYHQDPRAQHLFMSFAQSMPNYDVPIPPIAIEEQRESRGEQRGRSWKRPGRGERRRRWDRSTHQKRIKHRHRSPSISSFNSDLESTIKRDVDHAIVLEPSP